MPTGRNPDLQQCGNLTSVECPFHNGGNYSLCSSTTSVTSFFFFFFFSSRSTYFFVSPSLRVLQALTPIWFPSQWLQLWDQVCNWEKLIPEERCHEGAWPAMGHRIAIPLPMQQAESPALIHPSKSILIGSLKLFYSSVIKEQLSSRPKMN